MLLLQASVYSPTLDPQSAVDRFAAASIDGKVRFAPGEAHKIDRRSLPTFLDLFDWEGEASVHEIAGDQPGYLINIRYPENAEHGVLQTCALASQFLNLRENAERLRYILTGMRFDTGKGRFGKLARVRLLDRKRLFESSLISLSYGYEIAVVNRLTPKGLERFLPPQKVKKEIPLKPALEEISKK